jgi:hypothetical protein
MWWKLLSKFWRRPLKNYLINFLKIQISYK